ncbi:MAG: T9SS type A sorting domain-containing protein, partial [Flavobacteriales bacterium]|nr:T9SS type A sorting domain-containing protein [Flavobacteriales bacterium]
NPTDRFFYLGFNSEESQELTITITNLIGENVYSEVIENCIGEFSRKIDIDKYKSSIYFVNIKNDKSCITKKLILQ